MSQGHTFLNLECKGSEISANTFTSDPITVDEVVCAGPLIAPNTIQIAQLPEISGGAAAMSMSYKIDPSESEFVYDIENIDEAIRSVSSIKVKPMAIVLSLSTPEAPASGTKVSLLSNM